MIRTLDSILARLVVMALALAVSLASSGAAGAGASAPPPDTGLAPTPGAARRQGAALVDPDFGRLPLYFVENRGQADARVAFTVLGGPTQVYFGADGVTFAIDRGRGVTRDASRGGERPSRGSARDCG